MNDSIKNLLEKGTYFHMSNNFQAAHDCYKLALEIDTLSYHAHHLLGILFLQNGFSELSHFHFEQCLRINPNDISAIRNRSIFKKSSDSKVQVEFQHVVKNDTYKSFDESIVDGWRHLRMIDFASCFSNSTDTWLTLGDAHGHDASMLKLYGAHDVTASNLESSNLEAGFAAKKIDKFLTINAESMPLEGESFDYVLCKEALHHMPRPSIAIYEMLRVARKGIFFVEPQDPVIDWPIARNEGFYRDIVAADNVGEKIAIRKTTTNEEVSSSYIDWWEDQAFNYVYTFSKREIRKIALGMGLPSFAFKNFNDFCNPQWITQKCIPGIEGYDKTIEQIKMHDILCQITGKAYSYITGMLFKETPSTDTINKISELGYEFNFTPTRYLPISWPNFEE